MHIFHTQIFVKFIKKKKNTKRTLRSINKRLFVQDVQRNESERPDVGNVGEFSQAPMTK